jgi:hypothetical protein
MRTPERTPTQASAMWLPASLAPNDSSNMGDQGKDSNIEDNDTNNYDDKMLTDFSPEC